MWVGRTVGSKVGGWYPSSSVPEEKEVHPQAVQDRMRQMAMAAARVRCRKGDEAVCFTIVYERV